MAKHPMLHFLEIGLFYTVEIRKMCSIFLKALPGEKISGFQKNRGGQTPYVTKFQNLIWKKSLCRVLLLYLVILHFCNFNMAKHIM